MTWVERLKTLTSGLARAGVFRLPGRGPQDPRSNGRRQQKIWLSATVHDVLAFEKFFLLHCSSTQHFAVDASLFPVHFLFK